MKLTNVRVILFPEKRAKDLDLTLASLISELEQYPERPDES